MNKHLRPALMPLVLVGGLLDGGCTATVEAPQAAQRFQMLGVGNVVPAAEWPPVQQEAPQAASNFERLGVGNVVPPAEWPPAQQDAPQAAHGFQGLGTGNVVPSADWPGPDLVKPFASGCINASGLTQALGPLGLPLMIGMAVGVCLPAAAVVGVIEAAASRSIAEAGAVRDR